MTNGSLTPLAPPGAGLPKIEHLVARLLFGLRRSTGTRASFTAKFVGERQKIAGLVRSFNAETASRRVLIRRPPGLEDSSRDWSLWMTLDHLRIVHDGMRDIIGDLTQGRVPAGEVSTAAVKPSPAADESVHQAYEIACDKFLDAVEKAPDLDTKVSHPHPWFGPLTASGWYALAGGHMAIHRVQIERIKASCTQH